MAKPEYEVKDPTTTTEDLRNQLNEMHRQGYDFVTVSLNHVIYKKTKKPKKD